jgi:type IV secretory pathway TraG/TraD family ATPase VirD4
MIHRPGKDGQRLTRELLGYDGVMELTQAYEMIDEAGQGSVFYRLVISPDPRTEGAERDLHLSEIIEKTMLYLEDRFQKAVQLVSAEHDDHSPNRHTHMLAVLPGRLSTHDLAALPWGSHRSRALSEAGAGLSPEPADPRAASRAIATASSPGGATTLEPPVPQDPWGGLEARAGEAGHRPAVPPLWSSAWIPAARLCQLRPETAQERGEGGRVGTLAALLSRPLYGLLVALNRLSAALSHSRSRLHNARFAHLHELASLQEGNALGDPETSLLLGVGELSRVVRVRPTRTRRELGNLLVVAPTRGGKGLLATSQLLTWQGSVVVNDIKGELFAQTAGYRSALGPVYVIDPTGVGHRYDPLLGKKTEDELLSSATHLLFKADEGEGAIFTQRATVMLTQLFLAAREEGASPLPYVRQIIRRGLTASAARLEAVSPELATQFLDVEFSEANFSDRFLLSAWGTLSARMRPLLTETVVRSLAGADFSARELMCGTRPATVYLRWPERDLLALSPLVRLLWGSLIDELITTYDGAQGKECRPVLLLIDEADRTAIPSLADHATTVVDRGVSLWIAVQSLAQLGAVYGRARAQVLRDNVENQLYYRPANQETAEYLERCLGRKSGYAQSQTSHEGSTASEGLSEQSVPLLTAQEIKQLGDEDVIGFHRRLPPFQTKRMDWRRFEELAKRRQMPAPQLHALPQLRKASWQRKEPVASPYFDPDVLQ